jgi:bud site selection protein 31
MVSAAHPPRREHASHPAALSPAAFPRPPQSLKVRLASKRKPKGWELIEETLFAFEDRLREAVDDPHEGKRKCESAWPIHRIHYERNRYIYDMYYRQQRISKDLYEFLVREKVVDAALISKWRKPGYEILCSMSAIQRSGTNFGTTSICRVPLAQRAGQIMPSVTTGCVSCVSGDGINGGPVWWTDPYTAWAAKRKQDKQQKRKAEAPLEDDVEARLKALRGEGSSSGPSAAGGGGGGGIGLDAETEARLRALRGDGPAESKAPQESFDNKGYDSD